MVSIRQEVYSIAEIFDFIAKHNMIEYDPIKFRKEYKTLYAVIEQTAKTYADDILRVNKLKDENKNSSTNI